MKNFNLKRAPIIMETIVSLDISFPEITRKWGFHRDYFNMVLELSKLKPSKFDPDGFMSDVVADTYYDKIFSVVNKYMSKYGNVVSGYYNKIVPFSNEVYNSLTDLDDGGFWSEKGFF